MNGIRTQVCSASEAFSDPVKALTTELTTKIDSFISGLPKEDVCGDWRLEDRLDTLFALLSSCSAVASQAGLEVSKLKADQQVQFAGAMDAEIAKRVTAGDLFTKEAHQTAMAGAIKTQPDASAFIPKDTVTQLCADAKALGVKEGEKRVRDEESAKETTRQQISKRKEALQKAGLPIPEAKNEQVLAGTDEQFETLQTTYRTRLETLQKNGVQLAGSTTLLPKLYLPEEAYNTFAETVSGIDAFKVPPVEPLAGDPNGTPTKKGRILIM
jgi:hypothetical protein